MKVDAQILEQWHLEDLLPRLQEGQQAFKVTLENVKTFGSLMRAAGPAAAFLIDGKVQAVAGLIDFHGTGRAVIWILFAEGNRRTFAALLQKMRRLMTFYPRRRYEAHVNPDWPQAKRLAKLGGFQFEGLMRGFEPDGSDRELWALVNKEAS